MYLRYISTPKNSIILAWEIPWTENPGRLQFMEWERVRQDWATTWLAHLWHRTTQESYFYSLLPVLYKVIEKKKNLKDSIQNNYMSIHIHTHICMHENIWMYTWTHIFLYVNEEYVGPLVVSKSCPTHDPMDCSPPGFSVYGIIRQEYWSV